MSPDGCLAGEGVEDINLLILNVCETSGGTKIREPTDVFDSKLRLPRLTSTDRSLLLLCSLLSNRKQDNAATRGHPRAVSFHPLLFIEHADSPKSCQGSQGVKSDFAATLKCQLP